MLEHLEDMIIDIEKRLLAESEENGIEKGIKIGIENGIKIGTEKGIKIGIENGIKIGKEDGIKIGTEKGLRRGKEKERIEIVESMIKNNYSKKEILKIIKINETQYNQIQKDLTN